MIGRRTVGDRWVRRSAGAALACLAALAVGLHHAPRAAATPLRTRIVTLAERELGYHEPGNYCTIFGPCEEWCSLFLTWVWERAGVAVPRLAFTGYLYDWAKLDTSVSGPRGIPAPGDAVLFGTGPQTVSSSRHVAIVEAVYPGYLVTIEGDSLHGVRRFVVPIDHPQLVGEPGPIYAYASPTALVGGVARAGRLPAGQVAHGGRLLAGHVAQRTRLPSGSGPRPRTAPATASASRTHHRPSLEMRRLRAAIAALRAFQHMPYRMGQAQITWTGVDTRGLVEVTVTSALPQSYAQGQWQLFLKRFDDAGGAYVVTFDAPPDPTAPATTTDPAPAVTPPAPSARRG